MATRGQKVKLGIFLLISVLLLVGVLGVLVGVNVFQERDNYLVRFEQSISGLDVGAPVKLRGVRVGIVEGIRVRPENVEQVEVRVSLKDNTPIKTDTVAHVNMLGITGLKYVELSGGTQGAERLPEGGIIQAGESTFEAITGRANAISLKAEKVLNNLLAITDDENQGHIESIIAQTDETLKVTRGSMEQLGNAAETTDTFIGNNDQAFNDLLVQFDGTAAQLEKTLKSTDSAVKNVDTKLESMRLDETFAEFRETNQMLQTLVSDLKLNPLIDQITSALRTLRELLSQINKTVGGNERQIQAVIQNMRAITESLKEFSRLIESNPSRIIFSDEPEQRELP